MSERGPIIRAISTVSTSQLDDASYRALGDVCRLTARHSAVRVVGGHMVSLLMHAFPAEGNAPRHTADTDAAISTEIAASGGVHKALTAAGYEAQSGNRYTQRGPSGQERVIDLLVPSRDSVFRLEEIAGRGFDSAPGLRLALAAPPILVRAEVELTDGRDLAFEARIPPVEHATILKAYAARARREAKDLMDLFGLLSIAHSYRDDFASIGGWALREPVHGARLDAAITLHELADTAARSITLKSAGIPAERFAALVRTHVGRPG